MEIDNACVNIVFKDNDFLKGIYNEIQSNNKDFRDNVFIKNLELLEQGSVIH